MSTTTNITIAANATQHLSLQSWASVSVIIFSNSTQFDIQWSGFGTQGVLDIPAGQQWKLEGSKYNSGQITITSIDNLNVGGSGPVSITSYLSGEPIPEGTWPVTIPAQRVITPLAGSVVATNLVNTGNPVQDVITVSEAGSTGYNFYADNQGNFFVQDYVSSILTTILRTIAGQPANSTNLLLGDAGRFEQSNGLHIMNEGIRVNGNVPAGAVNPTPADFYSPSTSGLAGMYMTVNGVNGVGILVEPSSSSLGAWNAFYCTGDSGASTAKGFVAAGNYGSVFDATLVASNNTPIVKWNYGQILNSATQQMLTSLNNTDMAINAPTGHKVSLQNNNVEQAHIDGQGVSIQAGQLAPNMPLFSTVNGSVSGSATLYCPIWGSALKIGWITLTGYQTASNNTLLLPSQITSAWYYSGDISGTTWQAFNGASPAAMRHTLTFGGAGAGGTSESVSNIKNLNIGQFLGTDRIIINTTAGATINSFMWFIGV